MRLRVELGDDHTHEVRLALTYADAYEAILAYEQIVKILVENRGLRLEFDGAMPVG